MPRQRRILFTSSVYLRPHLVLWDGADLVKVEEPTADLDHVGPPLALVESAFFGVVDPFLAIGAARSTNESCWGAS